jgi:hypothetical protein
LSPAAGESAARLTVAVGLEAWALESELEHKLRKFSRPVSLVIFFYVKSFIIF